ncbi:hypothetical protein ACLI4Z_05465 [Natrialbaceae archaeon A-arb3/5]
MSASDDSPQPTAHDQHPAEIQDLLEADATRRTILRGVGAAGTATVAGSAIAGTAAADDETDLCDSAGTVDITCNLRDGARALYDYVGAFSDDGYTQESVDEMSAENAHTRIYQGAQSTLSEIDGAVTNLQNYISTDEPTASMQAEMIYSVLRTTALQAVDEGKSVTEARIEGENEALNELATPETNLVRQWNSAVADFAQWMFAFVDDEETAWSDSDVENTDHDSGETLSEFGWVDYEVRDDGLDYTDVIQSYRDSSLSDVNDWDITGMRVQVDEYTLVNGDTEPIYVLGLKRDDDYEDNMTPTNPDDNAGAPVIYSADGDGVAFWMWSSDSTSPVEGGTSYTSIPIYELLDALDEIRSEIQSEASDHIEEIMDAYNSGDVDEMDIYSSYDLMREHGDSDGMNRYTAELLAAGMDAPVDMEEQITIDHPDTGEQTGRLFPSWHWDELAPWEYEYDSGTLEIADESIDDEPELVAVFEDSEETISADDLENGSVEIDGDGDLETVERESQGELYAHIPVGETVDTDHWDSAIFVHESGDGDANQVTLDPGEPFELVAVEDADGEELDALELEGWENQERDPARSLEEAQRAEEQYVTVDELEETSLFGGIGGWPDADNQNLWVGLGFIVLVLVIVAGVVTDAIDSFLG